MSTTDEMTIDEIYKYLRKMRPVYTKASKKEKGKLLDEMETITGRHRKYICSLLKGRLKRGPRKRQRARTYQADFDRILRIIYESYDHICAERLHPNLRELAAQLASHGELTLNDKLKTQLSQVSLSTVRDRLRQYRRDEPSLKRGPRRSPNPFLQDIKEKGGLYDFAVQCDEETNTAAARDRYEIICRVFVKPTKTAEFVELNFVLTTTGADFTEIFGAA